MRRTIHELHELDDFWAEEVSERGRKSKRELSSFSW